MRSTSPHRGSLMPVLSLPSENVPAPPSPNCTLERAFSAPPFQNASTSARRDSASRPRSSNSGKTPARASVSAANRPRRPAADHDGRKGRCARRGAGRGTASGTRDACRSPLRRRTAASSPRTRTSSASGQTNAVAAARVYRTARHAAGKHLVRRNAERTRGQPGRSPASTFSGALSALRRITGHPSLPGIGRRFPRPSGRTAMPTSGYILRNPRPRPAPRRRRTAPRRPARHERVGVKLRRMGAARRDLRMGQGQNARHGSVHACSSAATRRAAPGDTGVCGAMPASRSRHSRCAGAKGRQKSLPWPCRPGAPRAPPPAPARRSLPTG